MLENISKYFVPGFDIYETKYVGNGRGGKIEDWDFSQQISGRLRPMSGEEEFSGGKITSHKKYRFYCELVSIKTKDRIKYDGKFYEVKFISNVMNFNEFLQIDLELIE
jgi:SPP1 family predicted phage head-tail adaptor